MPKPPKSKCCVSKNRCKRCPIRMLKEGTLPEGYGVKKRRLVHVDPDGTVRPLEKKPKKGKKKGKKAQKKAAAKAKGGSKAKKKKHALAA